MGPYSQGTNHTTGRIVETFYDQPYLMIIVIVVLAGLAWYWQAKNLDK